MSIYCLSIFVQTSSYNHDNVLRCCSVVDVLELGGVPYTDHALLTSKNHLDWTAPKLYVYAILNISVSLAFYGLMKFYYATSTQLAWCDPW